MTHKPATEDYVPLFPWAGVVLVRRSPPVTGCSSARTRQCTPSRTRQHCFAFLGRHSLAVYMLHQPILLGLLWLVVAPH